MTVLELTGVVTLIQFAVLWACAAGCAAWQLAKRARHWIRYHVPSNRATTAARDLDTGPWNQTDKEVLMKANQRPAAAGSTSETALAGIIDIRESFVEAPLRGEIRELLWQIEYPASGDDLLREAVRRHLSPPAIDVLRNARGRSFDGCHAVCRCLHI
ncbi:hypothetical protein [Pseudoclavibacter terrae]|uniref:Uncharacterized protein n=1 Tax=Pseudoclavibacter terrae TaxID=1530195 RepID=A0A7J5B001_9MICO|nr:hypothetical protein [Pseudoclavibacter terrae]KAB1637159.1 hypothetical protein F8O03_12800 [Pseudoclavibacter terrae]